MWFLLLVLVLLPALPLAEPIDSRQYGFLKTSMTMDAVRERFGAPDQVLAEQPVLVGRRTGPGTAVARTIERTTWVYKGDSTTMDTVIQFRDGVVERFYKTR
jgi:hypothetical protein